MQYDLQGILDNGTTITSSGTTGPAKTIYRSPENLQAISKQALDAQRITKSSRILTVQRMTHAGGLLAQTIPAFTIGCDITIQPFNAFSFLRDFMNYTHTSLSPGHLTMLMSRHNFHDYDLTGKWILAGSDPITWDMITAFVKQGATLQCNWGMSEVGPVAINHIFTNLDEIEHYKSLSTGTPLGTVSYCETDIIDGILQVKGDIVYKDGWLDTGDIVEQKGGMFYYHGRK
jgi:acyl-CoA synthetase (AMP-forming)/AMP-acid ligase II